MTDTVGKKSFPDNNVYLREGLEDEVPRLGLEADGAVSRLESDVAALRPEPVLEEEEDLTDVDEEELRETVVLLPDGDTVLIVVFEEPEFFTRLLVVVDVLRLGMLVFEVAALPSAELGVAILRLVSVGLEVDVLRLGALELEIDVLRPEALELGSEALRLEALELDSEALRLEEFELEVEALRVLVVVLSTDALLIWRMSFAL